MSMHCMIILPTSIEAPPECKPNIDLSQVLVSNDCGIEPDLIDITCSLAYYGNIPPVLEWRHSNDPRVIRSSISIDASSRVLTTSRLTLQPHMRMHGTQFICSVRDVVVDEGRLSCVTPNISLMCERHKLALSSSLSLSACIAVVAAGVRVVVTIITVVVGFVAIVVIGIVIEATKRSINCIPMQNYYIMLSIETMVGQAPSCGITL